ncbi:MAG TPA: ATP-binding protein [Kofleriaceae bacterium]|nr:ATP-binding protein [Kofleriaceae bacterium]
MIGTARLDHELRIQQPDAVFCSLLDATASELAERSMVGLLNPADRVAVESLSRRIMAATPGTVIEECVGIDWRTTRRYVRLRLEHVADGWTVAIEDALAKGSALASLVLANQRWKSIMRDASSDCMVFLDETRAIIEHNTRFFELMTFRSPHGVQLNEAALRGRDLFRLWNDPSFDVLERALDRPRPRDRKFEGMIEFRDRQLMVRLIPTLVPVAGFVGCAIVIHDSTDDNLVRMARQLAASNAELEQFAYIASHDLQEPLRMVASYTELLRKRYHGQLDERADKYINYAVEGARRMQRLINDLLEYSRVGQKKMPYEPVDAARAVELARLNLKLLIAEKHAEIRVGELPIVLSNLGQLTQLFQNLIGNAIKFTEGRTPTIEITASRDSGAWRFCVADNGIGIEEQYLERVFGLFQRLHDRDRYEGSGMGLAISKRIVERHGGRMWITSTPGTGSQFFFTLLTVRHSTNAPIDEGA